MRVYFLSARKCALKINGVFLGFTDGFERFTELSPRDTPFCELIPTDGRFLPVVFTFNENITAAPPYGVLLYLLPDGIAVYADKFVCADPVLRLIESKALTLGKITIYEQGEPQVFFEGKEKSDVIPLDERFLNCVIREFPSFTLLEGKDAVCVLDGTGKPFFNGKINRFFYDESANGLRLVVPLNDFCRREADCLWTFESGAPVLKDRRLSTPREIPSQFILCAFLQSLKLGADVKYFLNEELYAALDDLKEFFGRYAAVNIAPQYPFGAGVVYSKSENVYEVKYFSAEVEDGKIFNVKREL